VPEAVCFDPFSDERDVAFAYTNEATSAIVLEAAASVSTGSDPADAPLLPRVFAPGRVSPAVWLSSADSQFPSWSITGPDGVTRTATAGADTPECTPALLARTTPDPRQPTVTLQEATPSADGAAFAVTFTVTGVDTSVCPEGLQPEPVQIVWTDGETSQDGGNTFVTTVTRAAGNISYASVRVAVFDQCSSGGVTQPSWPGGPFDELYASGWCLDERSGDLITRVRGDDPECPDLPLTGGSKIRPN
jgi:hypothetical protein